MSSQIIFGHVLKCTLKESLALKSYPLDAPNVHLDGSYPWKPLLTQKSQYKISMVTSLLFFNLGKEIRKLASCGMHFLVWCVSCSSGSSWASILSGDLIISCLQRDTGQARTCSGDRACGWGWQSWMIEDRTSGIRNSLFREKVTDDCQLSLSTSIFLIISMPFSFHQGVKSVRQTSTVKETPFKLCRVGLLYSSSTILPSLTHLFLSTLFFISPLMPPFSFLLTLHIFFAYNSPFSP